MIELKSTTILFHLLSNRNFPDGLTLGELRRVKERVCTSVDNRLYLQISTPDLVSAVELHPHLFSWEKDKIVRASDSEKDYEKYSGTRKLVRDFGEDVPKDVAQKIYNVLDNYPDW